MRAAGKRDSHRHSTPSYCMRECQRQTKRGKNRLSNAKKFYQFAIGRVNKDNSANFPRCLFLRKKNTRKKVNSNIEVIVVLVLESKGLCRISLTGRPGIKIPLFHQFDWGTKGDQCWLKLRYISRNWGFKKYFTFLKREHDHIPRIHNNTKRLNYAWYRYILPAWR